MAKFKIHKTKDYTTMSNSHFREKEMSLKAKGLLSLMLSLPEEWDYSEVGLSKLSKDGVGSTAKALDELETFGYLRRTQIKEDNGKFAGYEYDIFEKPQINFPYTENPFTEKPFMENQGQLNTNILNTNQSKKEKSNKDNKYNALDSIPDEKLRIALKDFIKHRKDIKRPLTQKALELNIKKLDKLTTDNDEKIDIINQSIENGWVGLFPLKKDKKEQIDDRYKSIMDWRLDE